MRVSQNLALSIPIENREGSNPSRKVVEASAFTARQEYRSGARTADGDARGHRSR